MQLSIVLISVFIAVASIIYTIVSIAPDKEKAKEFTENIWIKLDRMIEHRNIVQSTMLQLQQADIKLRHSEFIAISALFVIVPTMMIYILTSNIVLTIMVCVIGLITPRLYIGFKHSQRMKKIDSQLVDVLILISNSLKAGYSFMQSVEMIAQEAPYPISSEFNRLTKEISLGYPIEKSMDDLTERVDSEDFDLAITVVKIQRSVGGNLSEILDKIVDTIRERVRIKGEINTLTAQGKAQGWLLALLPPIIFMIIYAISPEFMTPMLNTAFGQAMIGLALLLQVIGALFIKKIVEIRV